MRQLGFAAALGFALTPVIQADDHNKPDAGSSSARCSIAVTEVYAAGTPDIFSATAETFCENGHEYARMTLEGANNVSLMERAYRVGQVMSLAWSEDAATLQSDLGAWVVFQPRPASQALPAWNDMTQEFPFYPDETMGQSEYEALRATETPLYCYVQGMESEFCFTVTSGTFTPVGIQTFPG